jgi:hypothetical protein
MRISWTAFGALILAGTAIFQIAQVARPTENISPYVGAKVGKRLDINVLRTSTTPMELSDVESGSCRYVVLVSPSCAASIAAANSWVRTQVADTISSGAVPLGWKIIWISLGDSAATRRAFPFDGIGPLWVPKNVGKFTAALEVRALPAHVVLDQAGRVVEADVGARLLPMESYRPNCSIRRRST